jgi:hypothetical protein
MNLDQLQHELMIYDPEQNKAFCLNHTAAFVWNRADGKTTVAEMAKSLGQHSDRPMHENEKLVGFALEVLAKNGLLVSSTVVPPATLGLTRPGMLRQLGVGAMAVPAVTALFVSPAKAHASSARSSIPSSDLPSTTAPVSGSGLRICFGLVRSWLKRESFDDRPPSNSPFLNRLQLVAPSIAEHSSCSVSITYAPSVIANETAALIVTDSAGDSPETVSFSSLSSTRSAPACFAGSSYCDR